MYSSNLSQLNSDIKLETYICTDSDKLEHCKDLGSVVIYRFGRIVIAQFECIITDASYMNTWNNILSIPKKYSPAKRTYGTLAGLYGDTVLSIKIEGNSISFVVTNHILDESINGYGTLCWVV